MNISIVTRKNIKEDKMKFLIETVDANNDTHFDVFYFSEDAYNYFGRVCDGLIHENLKESTLYIKVKGGYITKYKYRLLGEGIYVLESHDFDREV